MQNQAFKFLTMQTEDEWCCGSRQLKHQENYSENGSHLQGLV